MRIPLLVCSLLSFMRADAIPHLEAIDILRKGGCVIVMRHASSPGKLPDKTTAQPGNVKLERQLDEAGRNTATAMGEAFRKLKIPVKEVWISPTFRAGETARYAQFKKPKLAVPLGDDGQTMQKATAEQTAWLQEHAAHFSKGTNRIFISHSTNLIGAFPQWTESIAQGEALILRADAKGIPMLVARIKIEEWPGFLR